MQRRPSDASQGRAVLATEPAAEVAVAHPPRRRGRWASWLTMAAIAVLAGAFFLYLLVPIAALLVHAPPDRIWAEMKEPDVQDALRLSFVTTTISTALAIVFGLPAAIVLARARFPGHRFLETLATLPTVLPPTVAGLALLLAYGRMGLVGKHLDAFGITIPFTTTAVVMAQTFVAAPFFVNTARAGLEQLQGQYETAAYTLRASPLQAFRRVVLPLVSPALLTAVGLAWARALGEFGATITSPATSRASRRRCRSPSTSRRSRTSTSRSLSR